MKRSTLFSLVFLVAISMCFFSSTVFAGGGGGGNDTGDTQPWEFDEVGTDSLGVNTHLLSRSGNFDDPGSYYTFSSISFYITLRIATLFENQTFDRVEKNEIKEIKRVDSKPRGMYRTKKLTY